MITASELRIGNYFFEHHKNTWRHRDEYHQIGKEDFILFGNHGIEWINDNYEPVLLTEDIFKAAGFKGNKRKTRTVYKRVLDMNGPYSAILSIEINTSLNAYINFDSSIGSGAYTVFPYKVVYLHQLQNLYFSLTGDELKIDL